MPDPYQIITDRIIELLEQEIVPWQRPWTIGGVTPTNLHSKRPYHGLNAMLLAALPFESPYYLTLRQANQLGGCVRKGSRSAPVIFWKLIQRKKDDDPDRAETIPLLRYYRVFNLEQIEGIDAPPPDTLAQINEPYEPAETLIGCMPNPPNILWKAQTQAYYMPSRDVVYMPLRSQFKTSGDVYRTLAHELVHSTGHKKRLKRMLTARRGSTAYAREELIAEMGAAFFCHRAGIEISYEQHAAYVSHWLKRLREDKRLIVRASSAALKAVNYICGSYETAPQADKTT